MYKYLYIVLGVIAFSTTVVNAAYNDVNLTTDTIITVGGYNLTVSGSTAVIESITVNSADFTVTLPQGSSLAVQSADSKVLTVTGIASTYYSQECGSSANSLTMAVPGGSNPTETARITPSSETCSVATTPGGSGSSGGGSRIIPPVVQTATVASTPSPAVSQSGVNPVSVMIFAVDLSRGMTSQEVSKLQSALGQDKTIYPEGLITGYFGPATEMAVKRFQAKYGIDQVGRVGPATRAKLNSMSIVPAPVTPATQVAQSVVVGGEDGAVFTINLNKGDSNGDVLRLQVLLNKDADTKIASEGPGSPGNETNSFGSLTEQAVGKFQTKYNIAKPGDSGFGTVGPKTRAMLREVFGK